MFGRHCLSLAEQGLQPLFEGNGADAAQNAAEDNDAHTEYFLPEKLFAQKERRRKRGKDDGHIGERGNREFVADFVGARHRQLGNQRGHADARQINCRWKGQGVPAGQRRPNRRHRHTCHGKVKHDAPAGFARQRQFAHFQIRPAGHRAARQPGECRRFLTAAERGIKQQYHAGKTKEQHRLRVNGNPFFQNQEGKYRQKNRRGVTQGNAGGQRQMRYRVKQQQHRPRPDHTAV